MILRLRRYMTYRWTHIIIHHSATEDGTTYEWDAIDKYHRLARGWSEIGYHFGVENVNGSLNLLIGRSLSKDGGHTLGMNDKAIGICLVGNYDLIEPTQEQYDVLAGICNALMTEFDIPIENIKPHRDYAEKTCPGKLFDMAKLQEACIVKNNKHITADFC